MLKYDKHAYVSVQYNAQNAQFERKIMRYIIPIIFSVFISACESPTAPKETVSFDGTSVMLENFEKNNHLNWSVVDDGVMGGRSQGRFSIADNSTANFRGYLSLENNGGFSSVRAYIPTNMIGLSSILLRVKGDGRKYNFRIRTNENSWVSYTHSFETRKNEWVDIELDASNFYPTYRGYLVRNVPNLSELYLREIGIMLSDKKPGQFELEIDWIVAR